MRPSRITAFLAGLLVLCMLLTPAAYAAEDGRIWTNPVPGAGGSGTELLILADTQVNDGMLRIEYDAQRLTYTGLLQTDAVALYAVNAQTPGCILISWVCNSYTADGSGVLLFRLCFDGTAEADQFTVSCQAHNIQGSEIPLGSRDVSELERILEETRNLNGEDYSPESWAALRETVEAGQRVLKDPMASRQDIAGAVRKIMDAIDALKAPEIMEPTEIPEPTESPEPTEIPQPSESQPAAPDTQALKQAIEKAGKISGQDYTPESYAALQAAMDHARDVLADTDAAQDTVDSAARALEAALAGLKRIPGANAETGDSHRIGLAAMLAAVSLLGIFGAGWLLRGKGWRR